MKVVYVGVFDEVFVPDLGPGGRVVKRGEAVEVGDELGAGLLRQEANWSRSERGARPSPSKGGAETQE